MKKLVFLVIIFLINAFAGQSIVTTAASYAWNLGVPSFSPTHNTPIRVEFEVHAWNTASGFPILSHAAGLYAQFPGDGYMHIYSYWDTSGYSYNILMPVTTNPVYIRTQRDPVAMTQSVEAWNYLGVRFYSNSQSITDTADATGGIIVGAATIDTAFFRVHNTLVPMNSKPPLTSDGTAAVLWWKFDGSLADSAGSNPATMSSGSPTYTATPYQGPLAILRTLIAPLWGNTSSIRTGVSNGLDGTFSYTQADSSSTVTCLWSQLAGPTTLTFDNTGSCLPNVTNVSWGDYNLQLQVTDVASATNTASTHIGAVTTDANWVIQDPDPNVKKLFGNMIAFGHNPWGYMDERALFATTSRGDAYTSLGINPPTWATNLTGTVSYRFGGDTSLNSRGTTLCASLAPTDLTATVCDATKLDFTTLPTRVLVMTNYYGTSTELHVTNVVGNVLTIDSQTAVVGTPPNPWPNGSQVGQIKVTGTGTNFLSTFCNAGNPTWQPTLWYTRPDGSNAQMVWTKTGCESNTTLYLVPTHDISYLNNTVFSGKNYSYANFPGYTGAFGVDFYGEEIAHYALWKRSGLTSALTTARVMASQYVSSPYLSGGDGVGLSPLYYGGGVIGAIISAVIDPGYVSWSDLVGFGNLAVPVANLAGSGACNNFDTRDSSYPLAILALLAQFDPNGARRAAWLTAVQQSYTREQSCRQPDNSWANSGYKWSNSQWPAVTMTNGSTNVTGTGFSSGMCYSIASGNITVTAGSASATGTGFVNSNKITIWDGTHYASYQYQYIDATHITLGANWPYSSGTYTHVIENNDNLTVIGATVNDTTNLQQNYSCTFNSSTQLTLNRPWGGSNGTFYLFQYNLPGYNQQPYMMGMKEKQLEWSRQADNTHDWQALKVAATTWTYNYGADLTVSGGLFYGRVLQACEPVTTPPVSPTFFARTPNCNNGLSAAGQGAARTLTAEGNQAFVDYYQINNTIPVKNANDTLYGNTWGLAQYTTGGVPTSSVQADSLSDVALASYKYTGFFFGMGMSHQWPAERLVSSGGGGGGVGVSGSNKGKRRRRMY